MKQSADGEAKWIGGGGGDGGGSGVGRVELWMVLGLLPELLGQGR